MSEPGGETGPDSSDAEEDRPRARPSLERPSLEPARPDVIDVKRSDYGPRIPWKWILLGVGGLAAIFGSYFMRQGQRQEALRQQMLDLHEERLTEVAERYLSFRQRLERYVMEAAEGGAPETYVHPRLNLSGLRSGEGLYLRVPADFATSAERIEGAALAMDPDAITRCLGIAPMSVRGLYEKGYFLTPEWVERVRTEDSMMELRVLDDQLGRHVQVDVPVVLSMLSADWFMLVIQRGETRAEDPVDVFLWDLRRGEQLLRARVQGRGLLVPVRLRFEGVQAQKAPGRQSVQSTGATDCSIASQIRALTGADPVEFESGAAVIEAAAAADAEAAEAAADPDPTDPDPADPAAEPSEPATESPPSSE